MGYGRPGDADLININYFLRSVSLCGGIGIWNIIDNKMVIFQWETSGSIQGPKKTAAAQMMMMGGSREKTSN